VLPFATTGATVDDRWLGMGFARDLLGLLALVENLQVSARSLSASFPAGSSDVLDIGRSLNVHYVLKGDVSLSAGHIDVNVRLIDAQTRFRVWSETYAGNADDVFAIQEDIARQVTAALRLRLPRAFGEQRFAMPGSLPTATSVPTHSFVAWRSFLHGREVLETAETGEALLESVEAFQQAIHEDPEFVNAYAGLCSALVRRYEIGGAESELAFAGQVCQQAVSLDSKSIAAQTALGDLYRVTDRADEAIDAYAGIIRTRPQAVDAYRGVALAYASKGATEKAEKAFRTAISVMPDDSRAYKDYGEFLFQRHRYHEVLEIGRALVALNPESSAGFRALADASFNNGEFVAAIAAYREVLRRDASPEAFMRIGTSLYYLGRFEEAAMMYDLTAKMLPDDHRIWSNIGDTYLQLPNGGDRAMYAFAMARVLIEKSADRLPDDPLAGVSLAYYCAAIGDVDCAGLRADEAVALQPDHPGVHYYRALISLRLGNEARAVSAARDALRYGYPRALFEADPRLEKVRASREFSAPLIASNRLRTGPQFSAVFR
jgi:TolB-like protein/tetratricopeptide (TPR) repeat protein